MATHTHATIEDLYRAPGKAELVNGELKLMSPTGDYPGSAGFQIAVSLNTHARKTGIGRVYGDNVGFVVNLQNRRSFSPDVAYYIGPRSGLKFLTGAPVFAVEVRSEGDYGTAAEREMAEKRRDYFAAATQVVWDVDVVEKLVKVHRASNPDNPTIYRRGEIAEAEPAVPCWRMPVEEIFV